MEQLLRTKIYFRVRKTSIEMLEDRGYEVSDEDKERVKQTFMKIYRSQALKKKV